MIPQKGMESVIYPEEADGSSQHGIKHLAGGGGANENAIPQESGESGQRNGKCPIKIGVGGIDYGNVISQ